MKTAQPDIIVTSPDGEYLMIIEVKASNHSVSSAVEQLKHHMTSIGCSVGLVVSGDRIVLLRDSLETSNGESIAVVGEANLPESLLPQSEAQWQSESIEFTSRVQQWLETLKLFPVETLPNDVRVLLSPIMSLFRLGEVRAAAPRWSQVTM
jgi:Type I restriction enzyme R protein N terminus (HSDR_N)